MCATCGKGVGATFLPDAARDGEGPLLPIRLTTLLNAVVRGAEAHGCRPTGMACTYSTAAEAERDRPAYAVTVEYRDPDDATVVAGLLNVEHPAEMPYSTGDTGEARQAWYRLTEQVDLVVVVIATNGFSS